MSRLSIRSASLLFFLAGLSLGGLFGLYLWSLYGQLTQAFFNEDQFVPTRIYSDVTRIVPPMPRAAIEDRLRDLAYAPTQSGDDLVFSLHAIDYPTYLLPDRHSMEVFLKHPSHTGAQDSTPDSTNENQIRLKFEGRQSGAPLKEIEIGSLKVPDLYLEPEIVATLSSGNMSTEPASIRTSLKFSEVPAPIWKAIIAIEDQHFLDHKGLDPKGILRAFWVNIRTFSLAQGGSTITQQLVKNLMARRGKNVFRKVNELFLALLLEARFEKEQILERYLNEVYLGQVGNLEVHGVAQGAQHFFGKKLDELNLGEIALIAGLIRGPGYYSPYRYRERALARQRLVLKKMVETGLIAEEEASEASKQPLRLAPPQSFVTKAPFFTDYVKADLLEELKSKMNEHEIVRAGLKVYTTLDVRMNSLAQQAVSSGVDQIEKRLKLPAAVRIEGALATVDQSNGFIKALVGGKNYGKSTFNRVLNMKRQVGSTFKPLVYLTAFLKGMDPHGVPYSPAHPALDAPWSLAFDQARQVWTPKNYEKGNLGWIDYRTALAHSVNVVAAKLGNEIGIDSVIQTAKALGVESDLPNVPSLALGVAELSPIELLQVYSTLAGHGTMQELTVLRGIHHDDGSEVRRFVHQTTKVMAPGPVDLLSDVLESVFTEGTARGAKALGFDRPAAGKTGTTSQYRDAWFAGYTPELTSVVWVGMDQMVDSPGIKIHLTGSGSALPIWVAFMKRALEGLPPSPFQSSEYLVSLPADLYTGQAATDHCPVRLVGGKRPSVRPEKFIKGFEPKERTCETSWRPI